MTVKSIIDVEINDQAFQNFTKLFDKYKEALEKTPDHWNKVNDEMKTTKGFIEIIGALMLAQAELLNKTEEVQEKNTRAVQRSGTAWTGIVRSTKDAASNIIHATESLLKWVGITGIVSGLLGAGGIFGIDRMAHGAANQRRSALGLGVSAGEQKAFEVSYGRLVDPSSVLSGVNDALTDVTKRWTLNAAGLSNADLQGKDTAQVSSLLLQKAKALADRTPTAQLGNVSDALGLSQFFSVQDLERLKHTSPAEMAELRQREVNGRTQFAPDMKTLKLWQDFDTTLEGAKAKIDSTFIRALVPLEPALEKFSNALSNEIQTLSNNGTLKKWVDEIGTELNKFATYLGKPQFQSDLKEFAADVSAVAKSLANALKWLGIIPDNKPPAPKQSFWGAVGTLVNPFDYDPAHMTAAMKTVAGDYKNFQPNSWLHGFNETNPLNMRNPGTKTGFRQFSTTEEGFAAAKRQLLRDENVHGLRTLRQLIGDEKWGWAPASDKNNVQAYVNDVSNRTGINPDANLNLNDPSIMAKVLSAMSRHEKGKTYPQSVIIKVANNTGGNAIVTSSQIAK